jgi:serine/threonine-protein kinase HipA
MKADTETAGTSRVHVYKDARRVGVLSRDDAGRLTFVYDDAVADDPSVAVSVRLPVRRQPYPDHQALPCFENLLPEGDVRELVARSVQRAERDVVGLLGVFGGECAGALSLWPEGSAPPPVHEYRPCTAAELRDAFGMARDEARLARTLREGRLSMSGAQDKLVLYRRPAVGPGPNGSQPLYALPVAGAPSTVLVKRERGRFPGLVQNEMAAMDLMRAAGVPTAAHAPNALDGSLYETARFDRVLDDDGSVAREHAEDGCQLTGRASLAKYARQGGPAYADLVTVLNRHGLAPLEDVELLFRWAVANLALGNRDAHAKNVSVLHVQPMTVRLAPAYDVVCTLAYPALDDELPLRFGGQLTVAALTPRSLVKAAREFRLAPARARDLTAAVCDGVVAALPDALHGVERVAGSHEVLDRLDLIVREQAALIRKVLLGG